MQMKSVAVPSMEKKTTEQQIQSLLEYMIQIQKQVDYALKNLGVDNFNTTEAAQVFGQAAAAEKVVTLEQFTTRLKQTSSQILALASYKNAVFVQATEPTGTTETPLRDGDVWFDSANGYKIYTYKTNAWVAGITEGLKSSFIDIQNNIIKVYSGGSVDFQTDDFIVRNAAGYNMLSVTSQDSATGEQGGRVKLGDVNNPVAFDETFVLPVENGGTGKTSGSVHRITSLPASTLGSDGDVAIVYNGASTGFTDITPSVGSPLTGPHFGMTREWNDTAVTGYLSTGNLGASGNNYGAYFAFQTPTIALSSLTLQFRAGKYLNGTWYGWNNGLPLTVGVFSSTSGGLVGSATIIPPNSMGDMSVSIVFGTPLTANTIYYIAIYDTSTSANKSRAIVEISGMVIPGSSSASIEGIYIKSAGVWKPCDFGLNASLSDHMGDTENPHSVTYQQAGAAASSHTHSGYVPTSRTVNGKALSDDVTLDASDVSAQAPIAYGTSAPSSPFTGQVWLKPKA